MFKRFTVFAPLSMLWIIATLSSASAAGRSEPWQMWFQEPASPVMERIVELNSFLLVIEFAVVFLVMAIMAYIILRFNSKANPVPSKTSHNTLLEVIWTAVPVIILVVISIPSLKLLYYADRAQDAEMTLKVTGHQWYWTYTYPDNGDFEFDANLVPEEDLEGDQPRLLATDNPVVLPINTTIRVLLTSDDVIHNWAVPSLGLKLDTVPGRTNETWVRINAEGTYYGMCSELCGIFHGFMPIQIEAVSKEAFLAWTEKAKTEFAANGADINDSSLRMARAANPSR
jgi:cytochrome c oxidase subunit 2